MVRDMVTFTGRVQGVGFRYATVEVAQRFAVAGYVQNLPDGSVRMVAEGEASELDALLAAIRQRMSRNIHGFQSDRGAANGEFGKPGDADVFTIRY